MLAPQSRRKDPYVTSIRVQCVLHAVDGWPAALQLARVLLRRRGLRAFVCLPALPVISPSMAIDSECIAAAGSRRRTPLDRVRSLPLEK
jgi:hypothetical protein